MPRLFSGYLVAVLGLALAGSAHPPRFDQIGEGFTGTRASPGLKISGRQFSAPGMEELCAASPVPERFVLPASSLRLRVGDRISFPDLRVRALAPTGETLGPVPVTIAVEAHALPILNLDDFREATGPITVLRPGRFRLRIRALCQPERTLLISYSVQGVSR